jgi:hypothetical protein
MRHGPPPPPSMQSAITGSCPTATRRAGRLRRDGGVAVPATLRLAERLRRRPRPRRRRRAARAPRPQSSRGPSLRPWDERPRDELDDPHGVVRGPRRPGAGAGRRRGRHGPACARPRPPRCGAPARSRGPVRARQRGHRNDLRAGVRLRDRADALEPRGPGRRLGGRQRWRRDAAAPGRHPARGRGLGRPRCANNAGGREMLLLPVVARGAGRTPGRGRRRRPDRVHHRALAPLAGGGHVPRPPVALDTAAVGACTQGADVRAHRGDGRGADHLAARNARRRAQLGLPLHLDPRRHLHPLEPARDRLRPGGA